MSTLPPKPDPVTEEPELKPGGIDAIPDDPDGLGLPRDLAPENNPAVDDELPDEIAEPDDKDQAPSGEADDQEAGTERDPEAGQLDEEGNPEPPA
ncbi:hypothetical protein [Nocardioides daphniae]|uniref:Uncharacterized protein n=1 Tax=Nocardioides daphniae TaxID=402297 RepID=A0A4P7UCX4_9ACTN|nr:hypothetical protein [Nocardioides daphniae]QCC78092.1 hypothetical protein E2C04_14510 [Nocardioides daphniae]GGD22191.1 hypothetical protein GCM10007231_21610 [Nocardioides daphniae]